AALAELVVELLGLFLVSQAGFAEFASIGVHIGNLLEARVIVTTYNDHVRLLSPEPFWLAFAPPNFTRAGEPTLLWNHYTHCPPPCDARHGQLGAVGTTIWRK